MVIVTLSLHHVKQEAEDRPEACSHCGSSLLQGWDRVRKPIRNPQLNEVEVRRFRGCDCGRTFRPDRKGWARPTRACGCNSWPLCVGFWA